MSASRIRKRSRRNRMVWGLSGAAVLALGVFAASRFRDAAAADPAIKPVITATTPTPARPGPAGRSVKPALVVNATNGAQITINGVLVGVARSGIPWFSDTLSPGDYEIAASVNGVRGCPSVRDAVTRTLAANAKDTVELNPRGCGLLELDIKPDGGSYTLSSISSSDRPRTGTLPLAAPLLLPSGTYRIMVERKFCAQYTNARLQIRSGEPTRERARLYCERG